jgi:hypothetical protein
MPYKIKRVGEKYQLYNISKKKAVNKLFNSKATAVSAGKNYGNYRGEKLKLKGNKLK